MVLATPSGLKATTSPFSLYAEAEYDRWRADKLRHYPSSIEALIVEIRDPLKLQPAEHDAIVSRIRRANMAIYAAPATLGADKAVPRELGRQFGLTHLDGNLLADDDAISSLTVAKGEPRRDFIPYTNSPIKWHTDGYYNAPEHTVQAMVLHCVRPALQGGANQLLDHEMAYLLIREHEPEYIRALMAPDVMTIPARTDDAGIARPAQAGPVFSVTQAGRLHMRYTARTKSIEWKGDALTKAAVAFLEALLASDLPYIFRGRLEAGQGLICNNVLHDRSGFKDDEARPRLLYRARYHDRIAGS
ncbi:MAG: TauD/TfdA family dioxygenase [Betaproteobacteria bacterium]|nr:TauD/TfdA family dioxygenase [Betaproteobacteria bacterium]